MRLGMVWALTILASVGTGVSMGDTGLWAKGIGGTGDDQGNQIAVDIEDNVYVTGSFVGTVDFDPGLGNCSLTAVGEQDMFVAKFSSIGELVWARNLKIHGLDWYRYYGIAVDGAGYVYLTGYFNGTVDFDPGSGVFNLISAGSDDIFVLKLDTDANFVWAKGMGGTDYDRGYRIAVDNDGNVLTTGSFAGTADFDPGTGTSNLTAAGINDIFVTKLDSAGNFVWAKRMGGALSDSATGIAVDVGGNVYVTGGFQNTADFDPGAATFNLTSAGGSDMYVTKLDRAGNFVWAGRMGGVDTDASNAIGLDNTGSIYITGSFIGTADFDPGPATFNLISANGSEDIFIAKLDNAGNLVWAERIGGTKAYEQGRGLVVIDASHIYVTGRFVGTVDFDPSSGTFNLTAAGGANDGDVFSLWIDSGGNLRYAWAMGGTDADGGYGIAVDPDGNINTTGSFKGTADFNPGLGTLNLTSAGSNDIFISQLSTPPPNAISVTASPSGPTSADRVEFRVAFDKRVRGFDSAADVTLTYTGSVTSTGMMISGVGALYVVNVMGITGDGTLALGVNTASDVQDYSFNPLSTSMSAEVTIDPLAPGLPLATWPLGAVLLGVGVMVAWRMAEE